MSTAVDLADLARGFRDFAAEHRHRAPFTANVSALIADDDDIVAILGAAPKEQQLPVLLLAAIHDQVLADPSCELAAWYPTVTDAPREDDVRATLSAHCRDRADELRATVATRSTQTNEVGRCALLLPALAIVAAEVGPIAWVDVGASGGLNLQLDRFEYEYRPGGHVGGPSPVLLETETRGRVPVPDRVPPIACRLGLDRSPIDLADPAEERWLRACIWPDQADRVRRLDAALRIAHDHPADVRPGDAVEDVPWVIDEIAAAGHPVVTNSWVLNYLEPSRRDEYVAMLDRIGRSRDLSWVFAESPHHAPGLPFGPPITDLAGTALVLVRWRKGRRRVDQLGVAHPHGSWLHWHDA